VATVTATTGTISSSTTVQVSTCAVQTILLNLSTTNISTCSTSVDVTLTAIDTNGGFCAGLSVALSAGPTGQANTNELRGSFDITQGLTDASGVFNATWTPVLNDCQQNCSPNVNPMAPNNGVCAADFTGEDTAGGTTSLDVRLTESVQ
jgi:hypothetical protein